MNTLSPNYFFDLSNFAYAKLFENCQYVWEALDKLPDFLQTFHIMKF